MPSDNRLQLDVSDVNKLLKYLAEREGGDSKYDVNYTLCLLAATSATICVMNEIKLGGFKETLDDCYGHAVKSFENGDLVRTEQPDGAPADTTKH